MRGQHGGGVRLPREIKNGLSTARVAEATAQQPHFTDKEVLGVCFGILL